MSFAPGIFAKTYEEEVEARERQKASIDEKIKSASKLRRVEDPEELIDGMEDVLRQTGQEQCFVGEVKRLPAWQLLCRGIFNPLSYQGKVLRGYMEKAKELKDCKDKREARRNARLLDGYDYEDSLSLTDK